MNIIFQRIEHVSKTNKFYMVITEAFNRKLEVEINMNEARKVIRTFNLRPTKFQDKTIYK